MFPMIIRATSRGRSYEYVHLCESVWKNGRSLRRTVVSLGRKDILDAHLDRIYEICRGHKPASPDDPVPLSSFHLGPFLVLRRLWDELGLPQRLGAVADRVLVLVLNRLTRPSSEHALADWLTAFFACDSQGRRFAPAFLSDARRAAAKNPRVKVQAFQLQRWYRTLDALLPLKDELEQHLFDRFRHLFALQCDLVFYDLTSTYFEGLGPAQLARHGYSRDKRPANPQILVGVAMVDGLPVSHTVFAGNRKDSTTVQGVIRDLRARFGLGRFVFVGDRGMKSESSVAAVEKEGLGYLMAVQGRRNPVMDAALAAVKEDGWMACEGWDRQPKKNGSQVQEVTGKGSETRRFLVHSPERERHERKLRKKEQAKVRKRLERLQEREAGGEFLRRAAKEWKRRAGQGGPSGCRAGERAARAGGGGAQAGGVADRGVGGADPGSASRPPLLRVAAGRGGAAGVRGERELRAGKAARGALAAGDGGARAGSGGGGAGLPGPVAGGGGVPDDEGRAGAAAGVAEDGGAGAGARAGGVAGAGAGPGVGEEAAEGGAAAEHAGGVGGLGAGQSGGVRDEGEGTQARSVREQ